MGLSFARVCLIVWGFLIVVVIFVCCFLLLISFFLCFGVSLYLLRFHLLGFVEELMRAVVTVVRACSHQWWMIFCLLNLLLWMIFCLLNLLLLCLGSYLYFLLRVLFCLYFVVVELV